MSVPADPDFLRELADAARRHGVKASDHDLAVVLPIYRENREGLERLRRALAETEEPAITVVDWSRRIER